MYIYSTCLPTERCIGMSNPPSNQFKHSLYRQSIVFFVCTSLSSFGAFKKLLPTGIKTHICPKHASPTSFNCTRSCRSNRHHQQQQLQPQHKSCQSKTVAKNCYRAINKMVCTTFFFFPFLAFCVAFVVAACNAKLRNIFVSDSALIDKQNKRYTKHRETKQIKSAAAQDTTTQLT